MRSEIRDRSRRALGDPRLQRNLRRALDHSLDRRQALIAARQDWSRQRDRAVASRAETLDQLPSLLAALKKKLSANGVHLHLAQNAATARLLVLDILRQHGARSVVKGKSMVSEEIELNAALEAAGLEVTEGDLGELLVQLAGQPPSHITAPALHLDRRQIARLLGEATGQVLSDDPVALTLAARRFLRRRFLQADAGITGGNFVVVESGTLVLVENESNIRLATSLPDLHIAITGIEKLVPRLGDLGPLLELLPTSSTGQRMAAAVSFINGPRRDDEDDGPRHMHLVLLDNGRQRLLADPALHAALRCIRCGACLNICPIFRRMGGHGYGSVYPGPIGTVLSPFLLDTRDGGAHAFACSLCGACDEICPMRIPLSQHILELRQRSQRAAAPGLEHRGHAALAGVITRPRLFAGLLALARRLLPLWPRWLSTRLIAGWTDTRALPRVEHKKP